jgi:hypothetical protein
VLSSPYRGGQTRDWLKTKCHQVDRFAITGFEELSEGRLEECRSHSGGAEDPARRNPGPVRNDEPGAERCMMREGILSPVMQPDCAVPVIPSTALVSVQIRGHRA